MSALRSLPPDRVTIEQRLAMELHEQGVLEVESTGGLWHFSLLHPSAKVEDTAALAVAQFEAKHGVKPLSFRVDRGYVALACTGRCG